MNFRIRLIQALIVSLTVSASAMGAGKFSNEFACYLALEHHTQYLDYEFSSPSSGRDSGIILIPGQRRVKGTSKAGFFIFTKDLAYFHTFPRPPKAHQNTEYHVRIPVKEETQSRPSFVANLVNNFLGLNFKNLYLTYTYRAEQKSRPIVSSSDAPFSEEDPVQLDVLTKNDVLDGASSLAIFQQKLRDRLTTVAQHYARIQHFGEAEFASLPLMSETQRRSLLPKKQTYEAALETCSKIENGSIQTQIAYQESLLRGGAPAERIAALE